ncbi:hypothetical protein KY290_022391 [Solanum tuberosum]|uniref:Uncharacterized protein n=1 Tax=Solanum tuberosum TaxID=4113 RepID=A0ABQ7V4A0_SOLTU|nr:hypothetical protein KY290_022391 [Solanum tuberosum]
MVIVFSQPPPPTDLVFYGKVTKTRVKVIIKIVVMYRDLVVHATAETGDLLSSIVPFLPTGENSWVNWAVGLGVTVPTITARLLKVTKQVSLAAETVEKVAEAVEKVADDVDKAAEEFAAKLPEGGKLRGIVESIEHLAEETEKDAQVVQDLMDKVEEVDEKLEAFISNQLTVKVQDSSNDGKKK